MKHLRPEIPRVSPRTTNKTEDIEAEAPFNYVVIVSSIQLVVDLLLLSCCLSLEVSFEAGRGGRYTVKNISKDIEYL